MNGYILGDEVLLSVSNLPELYQLIKQAAEQAEQLEKTIHKLRCYDLKVSFAAEGGEEGG